MVRRWPFLVSSSCLPSISLHSLRLLLVTKALDEQKKAQKAREKAEEDLSEVLGRLQRLRRQEEMWRKRGFELFERGMQEEDAVIENAASESSVVARQQCVGDLQSLGGFGVIDWDALGVDFLAPVDPGSVGGTEQVPAGSSPGS